MNDILVYKDIMEMTVDEFQEEQLMEESDIASAIIQEAKSCYSHLSEVSSNFFKYIDKEVTDAISKLKATSKKDIKIKLNSNIKNAISRIDKEVPDMLTNLNKYTKGTIYGKTTFIASNIAGWTIPPLIPIAGASEALFTIAEVLNYLLEFKRRWDGSNRSAINDFIVKCSKEEEKLSTQSVSAERTTHTAIKLFKFMQSTASSIVNSVMTAFQGGIIKGYKQVYTGTEAISGKIADATKDSKSTIVKAINKNSQKLSDISSELKDDAGKAIEARKKLILAKKAIKEDKRKLKNRKESINK